MEKKNKIKTGFAPQHFLDCVHAFPKGSRLRSDEMCLKKKVFVQSAVQKPIVPVSFVASNASCSKKQCNGTIICIQYLYSAYSAFLIYAEKALAARTKQFAADPLCRPTWRAF